MHTSHVTSPQRAVIILALMAIPLPPIITALQAVHLDIAKEPSLLILAAGALVGLFLGSIAGTLYGRGKWGDGVAAIASALVLLLFVELSFGVSQMLVGIMGPGVAAIAGLILTACVAAPLCALSRALPRMLGAFAAVLMLMAAGPYIEAALPSQNKSRPSTSPTALYIVTDEMIGIDGIDERLPHAAEAKAALLEVFSRHGFRVYTQAYSRHYLSKTSIPAALNFDYNYSKPGDGSSYSSEKNSTWIVQNALFEKWSAQGLAIDVFQSAHIDFCRTQVSLTCHTFPSFDAVSFLDREKEAAGPYQSVPRVSAIVADIETVRKGNKTKYGFDLLSSLAKWMVLITSKQPPATEVDLPTFFDQLASPEIISNIGDQVARNGRGRAYFVHLLFPHSPAVYNEHCKPTKRWISRYYLTEVGNLTGPELDKARSEEYSYYYGQVR